MPRIPYNTARLIEERLEVPARIHPRDLRLKLIASPETEQLGRYNVLSEISGIPLETLRSYLSSDNSKRYRTPPESIMILFGMLETHIYKSLKERSNK